MACRIQKSETEENHEFSYLLVTYAIELRAQELYPLYECLLRKAHSPITVRSILLEEKEHLLDMKRALAAYPKSPFFMQKVNAIESDLFTQWITEIDCEVTMYRS